VVRLVALVHRWPLPTKEVLSTDSISSPGLAALEEDEDGEKDGTFARVLRSKGTVWLDAQHRILASWSHAGRHFRLNPEGQWWATLPDQVMRAALSSSGVNAEEASEAYLLERRSFEGSDGDRRQEVVFIGTSLEEGAIAAALDACLLTDAEMTEYRAVWAVEEERITRENGPFRFDIGERVECRVGGDEWAGGTVVAHYYRESKWPPERWMPYQVRLDEGDLIWAPVDVDACIRLGSDDQR